MFSLIVPDEHISGLRQQAHFQLVSLLEQQISSCLLGIVLKIEGEYDALFSYTHKLSHTYMLNAPLE